LKISKFLLIAIMVAISLSIAACGGGSEPEHRTLNLEITEGDLNLSDEDLKVTQGDTVTMTIASDEHGRFHLHGYDHEISVGPGESAEFTFDATATGRFNFTFHHSEEGDEIDHGTLFESDTLENGQSFAFTITDDLAGQDIAYHNHMNHEQTGSIVVSEASGAASDVRIEVIADNAFSPQQVTVSVGSSIVWTNTVDERQRIVSGHPPGDHDDENDDHEEGEGEEVDLGALEVHPR
jgi:plastocyanin